MQFEQGFLNALTRRHNVGVLLLEDFDRDSPLLIDARHGVQFTFPQIQMTKVGDRDGQRLSLHHHHRIQVKKVFSATFHAKNTVLNRVGNQANRCILIL